MCSQLKLLTSELLYYNKIIKEISNRNYVLKLFLKFYNPEFIQSPTCRSNSPSLILKYLKL